MEQLPVSGGALTGGRDVGLITVPHSRPEKLGPEHSWSYFHPGRVDIKFAPEDIRSKVKEIDPRLDVVWHPIKERWAVWCKNPTITFWMCKGWQLIMPWEFEGRYIPLDNRLLANIYLRSPRVWGRGIDYWNRIESEMERDKAKAKAATDDDRDQRAKDYFDYCQIKNIGSGSKFTDHHSE